MRQLVMAAALAAFLGGTALAQGAQDKQTIAQKMREKLNVGPAFAQKDFLGNMKQGLTDAFGDKRGKELYENLQKNRTDLESDDVVDLMNGKGTKKELRQLFGCKRGEIDGVREALGGAVDEKNRDLFFGMMIGQMTGEDNAVDPESDEFKHICGCRDSMEDEDFEKLLKGNVSTKSIGEAFDISDKKLRKLLQRILNAIREMEAVNHPMCASLGMGDTSRFDPSNMPPMTPEMPGCGPEFSQGTAGGMPFDAKMPPLPFMGGNMQGMPGCEPPPCPPPPCEPGEPTTGQPGGTPPAPTPNPSPPTGKPDPNPSPNPGPERPGAPPRRPDSGDDA